MSITDSSLEALEKSSSVVYLLDDDLRIRYCNPAWDKFALANGGGEWTRDRVRGYCVSECVPRVLKLFYDRAFASVRSGEVVEHEYHCSGPEVFRLLHMRILPYPPSGFLVINSSREETQRGPHSTDDLAGYVNRHGIIAMCAHCRRVRSEKAWHWVPGLLRDREQKISHGLCPLCQDYFYGDLKRVPSDPAGLNVQTGHLEGSV